MIADVQQSTGDVTLGLIIVGGVLVVLAVWVRNGLGLAIQAMSAGATYVLGSRRIDGAQPQQVMGMVFIGLVLGLLLCMAIPERGSS